jgi:hypothetical protein
MVLLLAVLIITGSRGSAIGRGGRTRRSASLRNNGITGICHREGRTDAQKRVPTKQRYYGDLPSGGADGRAEARPYETTAFRGSAVGRGGRAAARPYETTALRGSAIGRGRRAEARPYETTALRGSAIGRGGRAEARPYQTEPSPGRICYLPLPYRKFVQRNAPEVIHLRRKQHISLYC